MSDMDKISREIEAREHSSNLTQTVTNDDAASNTRKTQSVLGSDQAQNKSNTTSRRASSAQQQASMHTETRRKTIRFNVPDAPKVVQMRKKRQIFAKALLRKVQKMSQKYRPIAMQPEKIEDLMKKMEEQKQAMQQDRENLNMTR